MPEILPEIIHWPVRKVLKNHILTPRRPFDINYIYMIMVSDSGVTAAQATLNDISVYNVTLPPDAFVHDDDTKKGIFMFYQGAEEDMDRYLTWLSSLEAMAGDGQPSDLTFYVLQGKAIDIMPSRSPEDDTDTPNNAPPEAAEISLRFMFPGEIDDCLCMLGTNRVTKDLIIC